MPRITTCSWAREWLARSAEKAEIRSRRMQRHRHDPHRIRGNYRRRKSESAARDSRRKHELARNTNDGQIPANLDRTLFAAGLRAGLEDDRVSRNRYWRLRISHGRVCRYHASRSGGAPSRRKFARNNLLCIVRRGSPPGIRANLEKAASRAGSINGNVRPYSHGPERRRSAIKAEAS